MKLGIYVGSFNPVHKGHIKVIKHLLDNHYLDKVMVIPTGNYWDKTSLIDIDYRIEMLKLYENDKIIIDDKLNDIPNTYLILRKLHKEYDDLYLVIGADNIIDFDKWMEYQEIIENNKILVIPRDNIDIDKYLDKYDRNRFIVVKDFGNIYISASEIRKLFIYKEYDKLEKYLDKKIIDYIKEKDLYHE